MKSKEVLKLLKITKTTLSSDEEYFNIARKRIDEIELIDGVI